MKTFERYTLSNYTSDHLSVLRNGYIEWDGEKWLTDMHSIIRLNNPRLKVPKSTGYIDIGNLIHKDLVPYREVSDRDIIKYDKTISGKREIKSVREGLGFTNSSMIIDNDMFGKMCKMNNNDEFHFLIRKWIMYLYTREGIDYKFEGFILGIKEVEKNGKM
jgi:hypothetical protein